MEKDRNSLIWYSVGIMVASGIVGISNILDTEMIGFTLITLTVAAAFMIIIETITNAK